MGHASETDPVEVTPGSKGRRAWHKAALFFALLLTWGMFIGIAWGWQQRHSSILNLSYLMGPCVHGILSGNGLSAEVSTAPEIFAGGHVIYRVARMPLAPYALAAIVSAAGDRYLPVTVLKTIVFLLPVFPCILLFQRKLESAARWRRWAVIAVLALPFLLPQSLGNVTRMQQEEGYVYSPLVLAVAILWLTSEKERRGWRYLSLFSASLVAVYLGKSSLILAVAVLAALYIWRTARMRVALVIVLSAGLVVGAWGCRSLYASGRFTLGTSLDGLNLHKGNNERFLGDYPPPSEGGSIDHYDSELLSPEPCRDEWDCNDFHRAAALSFLRQHPSETATGWWRKFYVLTLSTKTYGSDLNTAKLSHIREIFTIAMAISRVLFWAAVVSALWLLGNKGRQARFLGVSFILIALALIAPYLVGFALTRHFSLLIFLAAELLGAALAHCDPTCVAAG